MRHFPLLFLVIISACSGSSEKIQQPNDTIQVINQEWKKPGGIPDLPPTDSSITSIGIGKVILGQPIEELNKLYSSVSDLQVEKNGNIWTSKKIQIDQNEWIIAESVNSVGLITNIQTNCPDFITNNKIKVGMTIADLSKEDSLIYNERNKTIYALRQSINVQVYPEHERYIFSNNKALDKAKIAIISVSCEDC